MMLKSHRPNFSLALTVALLLAGVASGKTLKFEFTGVGENLSPALLNEFSLGSPIVGRYSVAESSLQASDLHVTIGDDYSLTAESGRVHVSPGVWFLVSFHTDVQGPAVAGRSPEYFDIQLDDPNNLLEAGLPLSYPIQQFGWDRSNINFPDDARRLSFAVESITLVPEPCSVQLLWMLAIPFAFLRQRRR